MNEAPAPKRIVFPVVAIFLAFGAPAGLVFVRAIARGGFDHFSAHSDFEKDPVTYCYVFFSTAIVFAIFGWVTGGQADQFSLLSRTDGLTGLWNAREFHDRLRAEVARFGRYRVPLSLLLIDVDRLKKINDLHGHAAGDAALHAVAEAIRSSLRETDSGVRQGGDEFAVIAPGTDAENAVRLADRLRQKLAIENPQAPHPPVSVSIGIASLTSPLAVATAESLLADADQALYRAKREGRDRIVTAPVDLGHSKG